MVEANNTYNSGGLNTTGREPFETPYGDNTQPGTGAGTGIGTGSGVDQPTTGRYGQVGDTQGNIGVTGGEHHGHSHHQHHHERQEHSHHHQGQGVGGAPIGDSYGANPTTQSGYSDRIGGLDQNIGNYERTGAGGPATSGAAGTDRFDDRSGVTGDSYGSRSSYPTDHDNLTGERKDGAVSGAAAVQPGPGQSAIGTNDKEFYDPTRGTAGGAWSDSNATAKTALTGREGSANATNVGRDSTNTGANAADNTYDGEADKPKTGFISKLKEIL